MLKAQLDVMLRITRRADASVKRTATLTCLGAAQGSQQCWQRRGRLASSHQVCSPRSLGHRSSGGLRALEKNLSSFVEAASPSFSAQRTLTTAADNEDKSTSKQEPNDAKDIHQLQETFESPPPVELGTSKEPGEGPTPEDDAQNESTELAGRSRPQHSGMWTTLRAKMQQTRHTKSGREVYNNVPLHLDGLILPPRDQASGEADDTEEANLDQPTSKAKKARARQAKKGTSTSRDKLKTVSKTIKPRSIPFEPLDFESVSDVPKLSHNLDRVLFNPGVYQLQDERTDVYNFDPYLASIMPIDEFDFSALRSYVTSSKDPKLRHLSAETGLKYCGSTSSMTSILSHFHFLLSAWRPPAFRNLSRTFHPDSNNFTVISRAPAAAFLHHEDGVYAIDADKGYDSANVLTLLGQSMEKLLTLPKEEFEKFRKSRGHEFSDDEVNAGEAYHFTKIGDMLIRSQLDAHDPRLPGSGMFDLKTRAVVTIRMDVEGYEKGTDYEIRKRFGQWESFEREYFDMIRSAFLKYSLQVRLGRMDGIFVAYHNTRRIFGFQYISLSEMDEALHGTPDIALGNWELKASISMLNDLLNRATERFPGRTLRLHVETRDTKVPVMYFFVEAVSDEEMKQIQESKKPDIERFERRIRGFTDRERSKTSTETQEASSSSPSSIEQDQQQPDQDDIAGDEAADAQDDSTWTEMMAQVEKMVENEFLGVRCVRQALKGVLEEHNLLQNMSSLETERHLDSLTEALTLHMHEANRDGEEVQESSWEGEEEETGTVETAVTEETGESNAEPDAVPDVSEAEETAEAEDQPSAAPEIALLKDLLLKVTDGIDAETQKSRAFEKMFASVAAEVRDQGQAEQTEETARDEASSAASETVDNGDADASPQEGQRKKSLLGMYVTVRNKVNGADVERPVLKPGTSWHRFDWSINYSITEIPEGKAWQMYHQLKKRRHTIYSKDPDARAQMWHRIFKGKLPDMAEKGKKYRRKRTQRESKKTVQVS